MVSYLSSKLVQEQEDVQLPEHVQEQEDGELPEHVQEQEDVGRVYVLPLCIQPDILTFLEEE